MAKAKQLICFDSCVVIDSLRPAADGRRAPIDEILARGKNKEVVIWVSALALVETVRIDGVEEANQTAVIEEFFGRPYVEVEAINRQVAKLAREIRSKHEISQFDVLHVATAIIHSCSAWITVDGIAAKPTKIPKLLEFDRKIIGYPSFRIITPSEYARQFIPLFGENLAEYDETVKAKRDAARP